MTTCTYASRYIGERYPNCNNGDPCQTCLAIWHMTQRERRIIAAHKFIRDKRAPENAIHRKPLT